MAETVKRLGQATGADVAAGVAAYTVPANTQAVVSSISVCSQETSGVSITMWHIDGNYAARADEDLIAYMHDLLTYRTLSYSLGITM